MSHRPIKVVAPLHSNNIQLVQHKTLQLAPVVNVLAGIALVRLDRHILIALLVLVLILVLRINFIRIVALLCRHTGRVLHAFLLAHLRHLCTRRWYARVRRIGRGW